MELFGTAGIRGSATERVTPELALDVGRAVGADAVESAGPPTVVVGRDGLIVTVGRQRGLLLPQVAAERDWSAEQFLRETARKAGVPPDAWQREGTTVSRFSAQVFAEESPRGRMTVEDHTRAGSDT